MFESIQSVDSTVFVLINQSLANPVTDILMPIITNDMFLRIGFGVAVIALLIRGNNNVRRAALFSIIALIVADHISSSIIKPFVDRLRPCHDPAMLTGIHLLVHCGGGKSFPSSHAVNSFAVTVFFLGATPNAKRTLRAVFVLAILIALSRVFVGVHYPLDITVGAVLGATVGWLIGKVYVWSEKDYLQVVAD